MNKKKLRAKLRLLIVLVLLLISLVSFAVGKYVTTVETVGTVEFTAELAENMLLQEHKAVRQSDGTYKLDANAIVDTNTYILVPGVDVPKDPHIVIENKTPIRAYLYVEIVDTLDTVKVGQQDVKLIDYALTADWEKTNTVGEHGGAVYKYKTVLNRNVSNPIYILADNKVTVSQYVKRSNITENGDTDILTLHAYLQEAMN